MSVYVLHVSLLLSPQDGIIPLYVASDNGFTDIVRILLENHADLNISDGVSHLSLSAVNKNHFA